MLKTILAVALFSIGAHAQTQIQQQPNTYLMRLQSLQYQKDAIASQRELVEQDRDLIAAAEEGLTKSYQKTGNFEGGILMGRIVTVGTAVAYGVPVVGRLYLDTVAMFKKQIPPEEFMAKLSMRQIILGVGSVGALFAMDKLNNLYVVVEKQKWPEEKINLQQARENLNLKQQVLKKLELSYQTQIQQMAQ